MRSWMELANCKGLDPLFDMEDPQDRTKRHLEYLTATCLACPVRQECLDDAVKMDDYWTFRGGLTPEQRIAIYGRKDHVMQ